MQYFVSLIIGYILGSIPTAYLLLKITRGIDIRNSGSGNVGALNSIKTSKSKFIGITVLIIDFAKGFLAAYLLVIIYPTSFIAPAIGVCAAVLSHNFCPWLKFKGGRGLATAAGGAAAIFPFLLVVWLILWILAFFFKKNVIFANVSATVLSFVLILSLLKIALKYTYPSVANEMELILFSTILLLTILIKHITPFKEEMKNLNLLSREKK